MQPGKQRLAAWHLQRDVDVCGTLYEPYALPCTECISATANSPPLQKTSLLYAPKRGLVSGWILKFSSVEVPTTSVFPVSPLLRSQSHSKFHSSVDVLPAEDTGGVRVRKRLRNKGCPSCRPFQPRSLPFRPNFLSSGLCSASSMDDGVPSFSINIALPSAFDKAKFAMCPNMDIWLQSHPTAWTSYHGAVWQPVLSIYSSSVRG